MILQRVAVYLLCGILGQASLVLSAPPSIIDASDNLEFIILHNNDMHARFEQTSIYGGTCLPQDAHTNKCYGGFARTAHVIREHRQKAKENGLPVVYLNAGDTYTGTPWFAVFKDKIASAFLNKLQPDVISLGNHEFDDGVEGLVPFLNEVTFPIVAANLDLSKTPSMQNTTSLKKSTVLTVGGIQVGIVGYLTPDTQDLAVKNTVVFLPEIESINSEAAKLKSQGINIIIALGHSGYKKDKEIALNCPDVDMVIGGHSHSLLYSGPVPAGQPEEVMGPYPTVVKQSSGKSVPVVQAYAFTKYLGRMHVKFNKRGDLVEFDGEPILLDHEISQESDLLQLLEVYRPTITAMENEIVGHTRVHLEGDGVVCRREECNLGNLIADAMVFSRVREVSNGRTWTDAAIALMHSGGIRNSIEKRVDGNITFSDLMTVLPYKTALVVTEVHGKTIRKALEHSAAIHNTDSNGGFLQVSGVHVVYDMKKPIGERAVQIDVLCDSCNVPKFSTLDDNKSYRIIVPEYIFNGGDKHNFTESSSQFTQTLAENDIECVKSFIASRNVVYPAVEERIIFYSGSASLAVSMLCMIAVYIVQCVV